MSEPAKAKEPSMEEILASIRRIIADDEASKAPRKPPDLSPPPARPGLQRPEVPPAPLRSPPASQKERNDMPLGEFDPPKPAGANGRASAFDLDAPLPAPVRAESERKADAKPHSPIGNGADHRTTPERPLLSPNTTAAVDSAFNTLAETVLGHNARTLEDMVREMLRPMLKDWLDDNLPGLVERLVRAEIERVSRGR